MKKTEPNPDPTLENKIERGSYRKENWFRSEKMLILLMINNQSFREMKSNHMFAIVSFQDFINNQ